MAGLLSDALEAALKGSRDVEETARPGAAELAERAGAGVEAGAQAPKVPSIAGPVPEAPPPIAVQAPADIQIPGQASTPVPPAIAAQTEGADAPLQARTAPTPADPGAPSVPPPGVPNPGAAEPGMAAAAMPDEMKAQAPLVPAPKESPLGVATNESIARILKANLGDFAPDAAHIPNFDVMTSMDQVKATIGQMAEDAKGTIDEARRGEISNIQLQALTDEIPGGTAAIIRQVLAREEGTNLPSGEIILGARQFEQTSGARLQVLAQQIKALRIAGQDDTIPFAQYMRQRQLHYEFIEQLYGGKAEAGRSLNAFGIPVGAPPEVMQHLADILKQQNPNIDQELNAIAMTNTPAGINSIVNGVPQGGLLKRIFGLNVQMSKGQSQPGALWAFLNRIMVNGIISGPPTWLRIAYGNTVNTVVNAADLFVAAGIGRFFTGAEHATIGEATANLLGTMQGVPDGLRMAYRIAKTGESLGSVVRFAEGAPQDTVRMLPELDETPFGAPMRFIDQVLNAPGNRVVGAIDGFNQAASVRGYMVRQAYLAVREQMEAGTLKQQDAAAFVQNFMRNPDPAVQKAAEAWATRMSFQDPLGATGRLYSTSLTRCRYCA